MRKTIIDTFADTAVVHTEEGLHSVYVDVHVGTRQADLAFTPKAARKLAKALKKAAAEAEAEDL